MALAQKERAAALNPSDTNIKNQATALYQVCYLLLSKLDCLTKSFDYSFVNLLSGVSHRKSCHKFCSNFGQRIRTPSPQLRHKALRPRHLSHNFMGTSNRTHRFRQRLAHLRRTISQLHPHQRMVKQVPPLRPRHPCWRTSFHLQLRPVRQHQATSQICSKIS